MTRIAIIAAVCIALVIAFLAVGSAHRDRCQRAGEIGCTLLPWSGHAAPGQPVIPGGP